MVAKNKNVLLIVILLCVAMVICGCGKGAKESTASEKYPAKPINVIVPFAAGGSADIMARALEKNAPKGLGQPLVIVNTPGGGGTIGLNEIAGAKPDGYTIGVIGVNVLLQPLFGQTRYHYPTALDPIVKVVTSPTVLATLSKKPWNNLNDLVSYAKERPGEIKFGHAGLGTTMHITGEMLAKETGIKIVQVPFKGDSEALAALLGEHVQIIMVSPSAIKEHVKSGTVRILGVAENSRLTIHGFENVPTFKEQGINVAFNFWIGVVAPKGIPAQEKAKLVAGFKEMINDPDFKKYMEEMGMPAQYLGAEEFSSEWAEDNERLKKIVNETGIADLIASQKK